MTVRVLIIAENAKERKILRTALESIGFEATACTAKEVATLARPRFSLAVLALKSSDDMKTARTLCARAHASKLLVTLPFEAEALSPELVDMGVDDTLTAPFSASRLALTVRNLLRLHFLERAAMEAMREQRVA